MIDMHSHTLFGVDDGSESIDESIAMIKTAGSVGFTDVLATPHYIANTDFNSRKTANAERFQQLDTEVSAHDIPINLYLGNECFIDTSLVKALTNQQVSTLNETSYVLLEVSRHDTLFPTLQNFIFELQLKGYSVILAHPERYDFVINNAETLSELIKRDVLMQINLPSLIGVYGQKVQYTANVLLQNNMAHLVGSDAHSERGYERAGKGLDVLKKQVGKKTFDELTVENPKAIIEGSILYPKAPVKVRERKGFSQIFKRKKYKRRVNP